MRFMVWDPSAGDWQARRKNGSLCLPSHPLPLPLAGRSACTASAVRRSTWWRWCPWRWRRRSANSCLTSRGTRLRTTTRAVPWRSTRGSRRDWSLSRYHPRCKGDCGLGLSPLSCSSFLVLALGRRSWLCCFERWLGCRSWRRLGS